MKDHDQLGCTLQSDVWKSAQTRLEIYTFRDLLTGMSDPHLEGNALDRDSVKRCGVTSSSGRQALYPDS
jgi:hypothetical protein